MGAHEGFGQRNQTEEEEKGREGNVQDIAWGDLQCRTTEEGKEIM